MDSLIELPRLVMVENVRCLKHIGVSALISIPVGFWFAVGFSFRIGTLVAGACLAVSVVLILRARSRRVRRLKSFVRFRSKHPVDDNVVLEKG
jgi:hypothetical protein